MPPGFDAKKELNLCALFLGLEATVLLFGFFINYASAHSAMYDYVGRIRVELPDARFADFDGMLLPGIVACAFASAAFIAMAYRYVSYHDRGGSRCIYTMRRLRNRFELPRRCLAIPVLGLAACQLCWRALGLLCGAAYVYATPERWLDGRGWAEVLHLVTH